MDERQKCGWRRSTGRLMKVCFAAGLLAICLGGYVASISESYRGKPRDDKDALRMKRTAILLILPGGTVTICAAVGLYFVARQSRL